MTEQEKTQHLCKHSEKMALCFALISTPAGTPVSCGVVIILYAYTLLIDI